MPDHILAFGIVAVVLCVTALASGVVECSPISYPLIFLGLGFLLGEGGLNIVQMGPHSQILEIVAALTLSLVLFLDAVKLQLDQLRSRWAVPALVLGPGTATIIGLGALGLVLITGFSWTMAFLGGAVLASTDPVVLREIVRDHRIPRSVRQILKIEAGTNDIVVLPVVLVLIAVATRQAGDLQGWVIFMGKLLLLGPVIGFGVGGAGSWLMNQIDRRMSIRREHQAFYGVGLVLAAYAAATAAGGDGFLAAFAAGLAVVLLNQSLCDCFLEYGEVTSEMAMLLAFVLFGFVLSGIVGSAALVPALGLAALVIFIIRPAVLALVLARAKMSWEAHAFVCWFGPRGAEFVAIGPFGGPSRSARRRIAAGHGGNRGNGVGDDSRRFGSTLEHLVRKENPAHSLRRREGEHGRRAFRTRRGRSSQGYPPGVELAAGVTGTAHRAHRIRRADPVQLRA